MPKKELIVVAPRDCPNCGSETAGVENCDYNCSVCGKKFCSHCYKSDPEGSGDYVFCPACGAKLYFPEETQNHP